MKIHYIKTHSGKDILIPCLNKWTEQSWHNDVLPKLEDEIYWANPIEDKYLAYTFCKSKTTCQECLKNAD